MTKSAICVVVLLAAASSAFGQIDATNLRAKYGAPLDRETFTVRPGIEMVVDYGPTKQVCQIQLPSGKKVVGKVPRGVITKQQIDDILNELVPPQLRGNVNIGELQGAGKGVTLSFTDFACLIQAPFVTRKQ